MLSERDVFRYVFGLKKILCLADVLDMLLSWLVGLIRLNTLSGEAPVRTVYAVLRY